MTENAKKTTESEHEKTTEPTWKPEMARLRRVKDERRVENLGKCDRCAFSVFVKDRNPEICWGLTKQGIEDVGGGHGRNCRSFVEMPAQQLLELRLLAKRAERRKTAPAACIVEGPRSTFDPRTNLWSCSYCSFVSNNRGTMKQHFRRNHRELSDEQNSTKPPGESSQPDRKVEDVEPWA